MHSEMMLLHGSHAGKTKERRPLGAVLLCAAKEPACLQHQKGHCLDVDCPSVGSKRAAERMRTPYVGTVFDQSLHREKGAGDAMQARHARGVRREVSGKSRV